MEKQLNKGIATRERNSLKAGLGRRVYNTYCHGGVARTNIKTQFLIEIALQVEASSSQFIIKKF